MPPTLVRYSDLNPSVVPHRNSPGGQAASEQGKAEWRTVIFMSAALPLVNPLAQRGQQAVECGRLVVVARSVADAGVAVVQPELFQVLPDSRQVGEGRRPARRAAGRARPGHLPVVAVYPAEFHAVLHGDDVPVHIFGIYAELSEHGAGARFHIALFIRIIPGHLLLALLPGGQRYFSYVAHGHFSLSHQSRKPSGSISRSARATISCSAFAPTGETSRSRRAVSRRTASRTPATRASSAAKIGR